MTGKRFLNVVTKGDSDVVQILLDIISGTGSDYCVIGGLAVNAYADPVVSLDIDIVVVADRMDEVGKAAKKKGFKTQVFAHSLNLDLKSSDLRVQIQKDPRYQPFISRAKRRDVLGYSMKVASLEDVLQGKLWAYADTERRASKRQKDLADILRLVETHPKLEAKLPVELKERLDPGIRKKASL
jgi:hypothetical protein